MAERDYSHRDVVDKLGVRVGQAVCFVEEAGPVDGALRERVLRRAGRPVAAPDDDVDIAFVTADDSTDVAAVLRRWKSRLQPAGGIWVLSRKRGRPGYVDQRRLITAGLDAGLVDNKSCSVSEEVSGIRFVIRKRDRA